MGNRHEMGRAPIPANDRIWTRRRLRVADERPDSPHLMNPELADAEMGVPGAIDIRDSPLSEEEALSKIGYRAADSAEQGAEAMAIGVILDWVQSAHVSPESTYANRFALRCEDATEMPSYKRDAQSYSKYNPSVGQ